MSNAKEMPLGKDAEQPPVSWYQLFLMIGFAFYWAAFAVQPAARQNWLFENVPVGAAVLLMLGTGWYFRFSSFSYTLIVVYLSLHIIGAHYNYSDMPFGYQLGAWVGDPERNYYDRLVHFCFGLLLAYPFCEIASRLAGVRGLWVYVLAFTSMTCLSALYEILEWLVAINVDPEAGAEFVGAQGDVWDSQKDMAMAAVGSVLSLMLIALVNWWIEPGFWHEMRESVRGKEREKTAPTRERE